MRKGSIDFSFIAKNPPSLLIAGGILLYILGDRGISVPLILFGIGLQILWLFKNKI